MKFAFSTVACPNWDLQTIATRAKEYGYDGVELHAAATDQAMTASNVLLSDAAKVKETFASAGIAIAAVSCPVVFCASPAQDQQAAENLRNYIKAAVSVGCSLVKIDDLKSRRGQNPGLSAMAMARWLLPLADEAAQQGVSLAVENSFALSHAGDMWTVLEAVGHPGAGCCWNVANAALAGEAPAVSVPVLNSRIFYTHVCDAQFGSGMPVYCKLGDGQVQVQKFLIRLSGIGYQGWVTLNWDKLSHGELAEPEEILADSLAKLKEWTRPQATKPEKPAPAAKAPAAPKAPPAPKAPLAAAE